ncbi:MAG: nucleotidyl transferase AbiEii/AbiGii toxin family protein [Calditrichia bacterium]|nr:nucleotidyl transferase AbiEii/AbiGii toxin family protein [Calditrichia bacterium]
MKNFRSFFEVINALNKENVEYILIGGFAIILYGFPRLTQDIDLLVNPGKKNITKLKSALNSIFNDDHIDEIKYNDLNKYSVIRYGTPEDFHIDIIAKIGETASYASLDFQIIEIEGIPVRVATAAALIDMKKNTIRPEDKRDVLFLKELIESKK